MFSGCEESKDCSHRYGWGEDQRCSLHGRIYSHRTNRLKFLKVSTDLGFSVIFLSENWNSLHNKYANKNYFYRYFELLFNSCWLIDLFSHKGMLVRAALAALDHNCNCDRSQVRPQKHFHFLKLRPCPMIFIPGSHHTNFRLISMHLGI